MKDKYGPYFTWQKQKHSYLKQFIRYTSQRIRIHFLNSSILLCLNYFEFLILASDFFQSELMVKSTVGTHSSTLSSSRSIHSFSSSRSLCMLGNSMSLFQLDSEALLLKSKQYENFRTLVLLPLQFRCSASAYMRASQLSPYKFYLFMPFSFLQHPTSCFNYSFFSSIL